MKSKLIEVVKNNSSRFHFKFLHPKKASLNKIDKVVLGV